MILKDLIPAAVLIMTAVSTVLVLYIAFFKGSWRKILLIVAVFSTVSTVLLKVCSNL